MQDTATTTEQEKHTIRHWIKNHKKQLIGVGISITAAIGVTLLLKKNSELFMLSEEISDSLPEQAAIFPDPVERDNILQENLARPLYQTSPDNVIDFSSVQTERIPYEVGPFIRQLHEGCHASAEKIKTAVEYGYNLNPGETWVNGHTRSRGIT